MFAFDKLFESSNGRPVVFLIGFVFVLLVLAFKKLDSIDHKVIQGLPEIPGGKPVVGHLFLLGGTSGEHDATVWGRWADKYGHPIFQLRFGNRRVVIANTYASIRNLSAGATGSALSSRPHAPVFDRSFGVDIGNRPMNESLRRMRTAASKSVGKPTWPSLDKALHTDALNMENDLLVQGKKGAKAVDPYPLVQRVTMNLSFNITYGTRIADVGKEFYQGYLDQTLMVSNVRNSTANWANYVPILMWLPSVEKKIRNAQLSHAKRKHYQQELYDIMVKSMENGTGKPCIGASLLSDKETKLSPDEIEGTCRSMLQGGSETIAGTLCAGIGSLSLPDGQKVQEKAYAAILKEYSSADEAWTKCIEEEKVPYIVALYKECLRFYTVAPFANPHETVRDVQYEEALIPKGTIVYFNAEYANHDKSFWGDDAHVFRPERWLEPPLSSSNFNGGTVHFAYGSGPRVCPALQISNHILYVLLVRLILDTRMVADPDHLPSTELWGDGKSSVNKGPISFQCFFEPRSENGALERLGMKDSEISENE